jgi:hypothetical protein
MWSIWRGWSPRPANDHVSWLLFWKNVATEHSPSCSMKWRSRSPWALRCGLPLGPTGSVVLWWFSFSSSGGGSAIPTDALKSPPMIGMAPGGHNLITSSSFCNVSSYSSSLKLEHGRYAVITNSLVMLFA